MLAHTWAHMFQAKINSNLPFPDGGLLERRPSDGGVERQRHGEECLLPALEIPPVRRPAHTEQNVWEEKRKHINAYQRPFFIFPSLGGGKGSCGQARKASVDSAHPQPIGTCIPGLRFSSSVQGLWLGQDGAVSTPACYVVREHEDGPLADSSACECSEEMREEGESHTECTPDAEEK